MPEEKKILTGFLGNPVVFGSLGAITISIIGAGLMSIIFYYTTLSESYLQPAGTMLYLICAFSGGLLAAKKAGNRGIMYGATVGLIYFFLILLVLLCFSPSSLSVYPIFLRGIYTLIVSAVGGIVGIAFSE